MEQTTIKKIKKLDKADYVNDTEGRWTDKQVLDIVKHYSQALSCLRKVKV